MLNLDRTIDSFRRGTLEFDCKRMVLSQGKEGGSRFEGQGYIRQSTDGTLIFKIYVADHNADPIENFSELLGTQAGKLRSDEELYELDAIGRDGTHWKARRVVPSPNWDVPDTSVLMNGRMQSITADLDPEWYKLSSTSYLLLHFFEEYEIPLRHMSETEQFGAKYMVRDRATFEACGSNFEVRMRKGSGETVVEATSDATFPVAFDLRVQEALQYITGKNAFWQARVQNIGKSLHLELTLPWRTSSQTQFDPPISPVSTEFHEHGWDLFGKYLEYVAAHTAGTYWNPMAYHLYNACESTGRSVDAWAVGMSVAVEAMASLIGVKGDQEGAREIAAFQGDMRKWLAEQSALSTNLRNRAEGQIASLSNKRPQDAMYQLAKTGHVEEAYIKAWRDLRNRHVHPTLEDLEKPNPIDYQKLIDNIHRVEVLLRQLTFFQIGYEGPFTDYGTPGKHDFFSKTYPLRSA